MKTHFQRIASLFLAVALSVTMITFAAPSASAAVPAAVVAVGKTALTAAVSTVVEKVVAFVMDEDETEETESALRVHWRTVTTDATQQVSCDFGTLLTAYYYLVDAGVPCSVRYESVNGFHYIGISGDSFGGGKYAPNSYRVPSVSMFGQALTYGGLMLVSYGEEVSEGDYPTRKDTWLPIVTAASSKKVAVLSKDSLSDLCVTVNQTDRTCSMRDTYINNQRFYVIIDTSNNIYANADNVPYVAHYDATATDVKYDYIVGGDTIDNSTTIDNSQVIDQSNGVFNYIDTQNNTTEEFYIDELLYDFSSQSYSADTYNITYDNDTYYTYNYTWNITYNITNTYVTNIGQTELYQPLELYYQLPDGRSSADLTAEEVASMSFEFADCVNYAKSATDTYLRALYHFDGNTDDSSYFSTQGKFEWVKGASISYLDVGTFDGALYLGPEAHEFKITLPSNIGSGDFSLQFRYYQEGAADTQDNIENSLSIGGNTVLRWDEGYLYPQASATSCSALSVGTWAELAVIRSAGTTYLYHNGLKIASFADTAAYTGNIVLVLGDTTRASSMLDEFRVVNFAVAENGASYTCTSVPYDTNAVLVLPDSEFPIADEYWSIESSRTNLLTQYHLDNWLSGSAANYVGNVKYSWVTYNHDYLYPQFMIDSNVLSFEPGDYGVSLRRLFGVKGYTYFADGLYVGVDAYSRYPYGICSHLGWIDWEDGTSYAFANASTYTFSMVAADGSVGSLTFTMPPSGYFSQYFSSWRSVIEFNGYYIGVRSSGYSDEYGSLGISLCIVPIEETGGEFIYLELVEGDTTDLTAEWVTCMYSSEEVKPNTAAIQTDIPIKGYTVGGVRPTFPTRGDVWMPVSNNRISGCYIYNGTAWESVNARWYTGTRWIPIYAFDLTTLQDCWDIADIDSVVSTIATESEFWNWWKNAWTDFRSWLSGNIGGASGSNAVGSDKLPDEDSVEDNPDTEEDESKVGYSIFDLAKALVDGTWKFVKGIVRTATGGITGIFTAVVNVDGFFDAYDDGSEIFGIVSYGGDDIWD